MVFELPDALAEGGAAEGDGAGGGAEVEEARAGDEAAERVEGGDRGAEGRHEEATFTTPGAQRG